MLELSLIAVFLAWMLGLLSSYAVGGAIHVGFFLALIFTVILNNRRRRSSSHPPS